MPQNETSCGYKNGRLRPCSPLAMSYIPMQESAFPQYDSEEALTRGTLFPGLDLPFMNSANQTNPCAGTPRGELMALSFMINEFNLYLDTHPEDEEALSALKKVISLYQDGLKKYTKLYGPMTVTDLEDASAYTWINGPWPWEYSGARRND